MFSEMARGHIFPPRKKDWLEREIAADMDTLIQPKWDMDTSKDDDDTRTLLYRKVEVGEEDR